VHCIARAKPFGQATCKTETLEAEAYCEKRYFVFTGLWVKGSPAGVEPRPNEVTEVIAEIRQAGQAAQAKLATAARAVTDLIGGEDNSLNARIKRGQLLGGLKPISPVFANEPPEALKGTDYEPPDFAKLDSALEALHGQMASDEGFWMNRVCRPLANEVRRHENECPNAPPIKEQIWELLDKHSKASAEEFNSDRYDKAGNRDRFERVIEKDYDNRVQQGGDLSLAGSIYIVAEQRGWSWVDIRITPGVNAGGVGGNTGASAGANTSKAHLSASSGKLLRGNGKYIKAWNVLSKSGLLFQRDDFHQVYLYHGEKITDALIRKLRNYIIAQISEDPGKDNVLEVVCGLGDLNAFDPEIDYYKSLTWDGVNRIDFLFVKYHKAKDTPLNRVIGRKLMIAKARRAIYPGSEHDWMPILEAPQGYEKTKFCRILAGSSDRFTDASIAHKSEREQQEALAGRTVQEMSELSDMKRADKEALKTYLSRTHDRAREAYGRIPKDQPRRNIVIGTTNEGYGYLYDDENRRMQPLKVGRADIPLLEQDRDQLHAEAYAAALGGESSIIPQQLWEEAARQQNKRRTTDPWEDVISRVVEQAINANTGPRKPREYPSIIAEVDHKGRKVWVVTSESIMSGILNIDPKQQRGYDGKRVVGIMGRLGWTRIRLKINGMTTRGFIYELKSRGINPGEWHKYTPIPVKNNEEDDGDDDE
jgi:hypothetical protein